MMITSLFSLNDHSRVKHSIESDVRAENFLEFRQTSCANSGHAFFIQLESSYLQCKLLFFIDFGKSNEWL